MEFDEENGKRPSQQSERWQARLLQAAHDAFIVHDQTGRVLFWNQGATRLYGWSEQEALGQHLHTLLSTQSSISLEEIEHALRESGSWEGELEQSRRDGTPLIVASRWILLEQPKTPSLKILEVNRDITDLRRTLQHLRFLTEASKLLVSSLNYQEVLVQVAQRAVPMVADWCRIDLLGEDGTLSP